jgi:hypothetical protein
MSNQLTFSAIASVLALTALTLSVSVPAPSAIEAHASKSGALVPALIN